MAVMVFGLSLQNCALQYSALLEKVETPRCVSCKSLLMNIILILQF